MESRRGDESLSLVSGGPLLLRSLYISYLLPPVVVSDPLLPSRTSGNMRACIHAFCQTSLLLSLFVSLSCFLFTPYLLSSVSLPPPFPILPYPPLIFCSHVSIVMQQLPLSGSFLTSPVYRLLLLPLKWIPCRSLTMSMRWCITCPLCSHSHSLEEECALVAPSDMELERSHSVLTEGSGQLEKWW